MNDAASGTPRRITIDVISDAVCPWCFVGKHNLDAAMTASHGVDIDVRWRPFQLDPTIPPGGMSRKDYLERKFGPGGGNRMHTRIEEMGRQTGIAFAFDRIARSPNTLVAHRLIRWARAAGTQAAVVERLFNIYFVEGGDIGDRDLLADVAAANGLDRADIRARLETDVDRAAVEEEIATAQRIGVNGVPFFIVDGRIGLSGAQPPQVIADAIAKALETPAESDPS
jgi:predicted DsbA family dithiol-disulfide isomerase